MSKFLVETYYTCTFRYCTIDELNEKILSDIDNRNDGKVEIIDVQQTTEKLKKQVITRMLKKLKFKIKQELTTNQTIKVSEQLVKI